MTHIECMAQGFAPAKYYGLYLSVQDEAGELDGLSEFQRRKIPRHELAKRIEKGDGWPLIISMPCGEMVSYATLDDLPFVDVPCPCGDPDHLVLAYNTQGFMC